MLKKEKEIINYKNINYLVKKGKKQKYKPWLGDSFSFLYDKIMEKNIFPKKFDASLNKHEEILKELYKEIKNQKVLELATGSGNASELLNSNIVYRGIDISEGLLKRAYRKFKKNQFKDFELYITEASRLPFLDKTFDSCICNLSLNFFDDINKVLEEVKRVLKKGGTFYCSVPIPERNIANKVIRGNLYTQKELNEIFRNKGFEFKVINFNNGVLCYFKSILKN